MIKKQTLGNGLRIVCERIPYVRSLSVGVWVGAGSRNETPDNNGVSHFIEHMLFKGTSNRTAKEIAEIIDNIGGQMNAFTGKECTCFYTKTLDSHLDISFDILSDIIFNSLLSEKDINIERNVILEEINMYEDTPEEIVHDILSESVWEGDSLGLPILGTEESLERLSRDDLVSYMKDYYTPENCLIAVAGNFRYENILELAQKYFGHWKGSKIPVDYPVPKYKPQLIVKEKDTEQVHICIGYNGIEQGDDDIYTLLAVNNILGGGASSRLFQKIREQMGLVYSIYSYPSTYQKAGLFTIYAGMNPEYTEQVVELIKNEVNVLLQNKLTKDELEKSKEQLKGSYILGLEGTGNRMNNIGKSELLLNRIYTPRQILNIIDKITLEKASDVIEKVFSSKPSIAAVGSLKDMKALKEYMK